MKNFTFKWCDMIEAARQWLANNKPMSIPGGDSLWCMIDSVDRGQSWFVQKDWYQRASRQWKVHNPHIGLAEFIGTERAYC